MTQLCEATVELSGWQQHECVVCAAKFSYRISRKCTARALTPEEAREFAEERCEKRLEYQVEPHPCPACGCIQPGMFVHGRCLRHLAVFLGVVILLIPPTVVVAQAHGDLARLERALEISLSPIACVAFGGLLMTATFLHFVFALKNPNRNPELGLVDAEQEVRQGSLTLDQPGVSRPRLLNHNFAGLVGFRKIALVSMFIGAMAPLSLEAYRWQRGLHANPGWHPAVVGPGDSACWTSPMRIETISNLSNGNLKTHVVKATDPQLEGLEFFTSSSNDNWDGIIGLKSENFGRDFVWAKPAFPEDARFESQRLELQIEGVVTFPTPTADGHYENQVAQVSERAIVQLSASGAGTLYHRLFGAALACGLGCYLLGAARILLADDFLRRRGWQTEFFRDIPIT